MDGKYEITCSLCMVTFSSRNQQASIDAHNAHIQQMHNMMTGEHWYERFVDKYLNIKMEDQNTETILAAAKEAARLES